MTSERFNRVLAVYQVLPGPEAHELCVYFGMLSRGRIGGVLAGLGFMLPGFALMFLISWLYVRFGLDRGGDTGSRVRRGAGRRRRADRPCGASHRKPCTAEPLALGCGRHRARGAIARRALPADPGRWWVDVPACATAPSGDRGCVCGHLRRCAPGLERSDRLLSSGALRRRDRCRESPPGAAQPHAALPVRPEGRLAHLRRRLHRDPVSAAGRGVPRRVDVKCAIPGWHRPFGPAARTADHLRDLRGVHRRRSSRRAAADGWGVPSGVRLYPGCARSARDDSCSIRGCGHSWMA